MTVGQKRKCEDIAEHYGKKHQEAQTISELSELLCVLTRRQSQRGIDWKNNLIDEIADVEIMIQQMIALHKLDSDIVNERINYKLNRQLERMKQEG
jgi:hypothetical protein